MTTLVGLYPTPRRRSGDSQPQELLLEACQGGEFVHGHLSRNRARTGLSFGASTETFRRPRSIHPSGGSSPLRVIRLHGPIGSFLAWSFAFTDGDRRRMSAQGDGPLAVVEGGEGEFTALLRPDGDVLRAKPEPVEGDLHRGSVVRSSNRTAYRSTIAFFMATFHGCSAGPSPWMASPRDLSFRRSPRGVSLRHEAGHVRLAAGGTAHGDRSPGGNDFPDPDLLPARIDLRILQGESGIFRNSSLFLLTDRRSDRAAPGR